MTISASISRRSLLQAGAGAAIPLFAGCVSLPGAQPLPIDPAMQADWLWHRQLWMNNLGPRLTGNPAHLAFVDFIAAELAAMGLVVQEDVQHFPRWEAGRSAIAVRENGLEADAIAVASDYPYSASTGPDGITGPLVFGGSVGAERSGVDLKDAILYLDAPVAPLEFGRLYDDVRRYGTLQDFPAAVAQASGQIVSAPGLESYSERGAKAVILGWTNISEEQAQGQYIPFNRPPQAIPGLWVGPGAATRLKSLAPSSPEINLTLDAKVIPDAASRTVYAVVPGASDDLIIVTTHSDGPNATEENGPLAKLAMARNLMQADPASRSCSVLFVFASGHFVGPAAGSTDRFLELHPEYRARAVAGLAVEHLGCMEWQDDASGRYAPTGEAEMSLIFTHGDGMADIAIAAARSSADRRGAVVRAKDLTFFFGEGRPLARAGIPTIGFLPAPSYLLATGRVGHIEKLDRGLFEAQVALCQTLLERLLIRKRLGA